MITPKSLDPIRNDNSACRRVRSARRSARRSRHAAGHPARGTGRDRAAAVSARRRCGATASAGGRRNWPTRQFSKQPRTWNSRWPRRWPGWKQWPRRRPGRPRASRRSATAVRLPSHLSRVELVVDIDDKVCACCGGSLHQIGEDRAEMLDYVPAQFRVRLIRRPRYGCRACENAVVQAPAPDRPIDGGMATEALIAQVLIGKYSDHLPLYRQSQIFARQGIELDRSTLCNWVGRAAGGSLRCTN